MGGGGMNSRLFKQGRVWKYLQSLPNGGQRQDVITKFGLTPCAASNILQRMQADGTVRMEGSTRHARWFATNKKPEDKRGCNANSIAAIVKGHKQWDIGLKAAAVARGRDPERVTRKRRVRTYSPMTELEKCWAMPFSGSKESDSESELGTRIASRVNVEPAEV